MIETDPLSRVFRLLRIAKLDVGEAVFSPPWGISVPPGRLSFYALRSGCCCLTLDDSTTTHRLHAGDFVLLADGIEHSLRDEPTSETIPLPIERSVRQIPVANELNRPDDCSLVYAHASLEPIVGNLFKQYLPNLIRVHQNDCKLLETAGPLLDMISNERRSAAGGSRSIAEQLVYVLIMLTIRSYHLACETRSSGGEAIRHSGILDATADPRIGPILDAIHSHPGDPWTVVGMAKRSQMSKSAFSDVFRETVGKSPMQFVTTLRIHKACELLSGTDLTIKQIAASMGYGSASSFSSAFRRELGKSPMAFRDVHGRQT